MTGRLHGKVCMITGTGGSMGRAAALLFAREGAKLVGCDINPATGQETLEEVRAAGGDMISLHPCDLTNRDECAKLVEQAIQAFGTVDILFNNAAMAYFEPFGEMSDDCWYNTINAELHIVFTLTRAAWSTLSVRGGSIVTTASAAGWAGTPALGAAAHAAAKGGIIALTRQLAAEGAAQGIRVNSISPGLIETTQTRDLLKDPEFRRAAVEGHLIKRPGRPEEVAQAALFLASDESSFVTGADLRVDGGFSAC